MHFRSGDTRRRLQVVFVVSTLLFLAVIGRVVFLQTAGSESLLAAGKAQRVSESVLVAERGTIFARDGGELALSVSSSTLWANPKLVVDPSGASSVLATMLHLSTEKQQSLLDSFTTKDKSFVYIARQIDDDLAATVLALDLPGVALLHENRRIMPSGEVGRSVLGLTDIDGVGLAGIELQYNELLTGRNGERVREHDKDGRSIPGSGATTIEPVPGDDLVLTLERSLQFQVEQALLARVEELSAFGGTVIVMDSATGEIYAIANVQRTPVAADGTGGDVEVTSGNLAAVEPFEPGSVAKVFSLAGVVDAGVANPDTSIDVPGYIIYDKGTAWEERINDAAPHDLQPMTLRDIIVNSSNIGTVLLTQQLGYERYGAYLEAFGFGQKTELGFPDESAGIWHPPSEWQGTERVNPAYGYGYSATSLQLVAAVNTVANGGVYVAPKLLKATLGANGEINETDPSPTHEVISPASAATMTGLMTDVVCYGTGKLAQLPGMSVAGKTGTAYKENDGSYGEDGNRKYRATFVGFFPAQAPRVTILVTIDEPDPTSHDRFGGTAAAPLFTTVATAAIHELLITPPANDAGCPAG
ncbi:MAG: penicillin-binding protein 2 [Actinomycetia bacterium]|nr:penicillin-binding protein 2 [Actinomycetes bacterium]